MTLHALTVVCMFIAGLTAIIRAFLEVDVHLGGLGLIVIMGACGWSP